MLLGRPWLHSANIKQNWQHNCISFRRWQSKVGVPAQETSAPTKAITPFYAEEINMFEGPDDMELETYLDENPRIVPLFEIDVLETASEQISTSAPNNDDYRPDPESVLELSKA